MKTKLFLLLLLLLVGCDEIAEQFPTITPTDVGVTAVPSATEALPTETLVPTLEPTINPEEFTPTPICVGGDCPIQVYVTPIGFNEWEYKIISYFKIKCVAKSSYGTGMSCNIRKVPRVENYDSEGNLQVRAVDYGTILDASALYHCEMFTYCDPNITDWYYTFSHEWAAAVPDVWEYIAPEE